MDEERPDYKRRRILLGLLGAPIKSSASPKMHENAARALGMHCHYQLIEIAGANRTTLQRLLHSVRDIGFAGINVTFPYKEAVVDLLDELTPAAKAIAAVNTIVIREGKLIGSNTDASGFRRVIEPYLRAGKKGPVALVGAGGVGKAIAYALDDPASAGIRLFDRDPTKMTALASISGTHITCCNTIEEAMHGAVGVINATPVGMSPDQRSPVPDTLIRPGMFVSDAVYTPLWTPLLLAAKAAGAATMTGRALAVAQAADAFRLFTDAAASESVMSEAFDDAMMTRAINKDI